LRVQPEQIAQLAAALQQAFKLDTQALSEAVASHDMFQALTSKTFIKIVFHVGEEVPNELKRSLRTELVPGVTVNIPTLEDAIASKLYWIKLGSHKSREDVLGMLNSEYPINHEQLAQVCEQMGLQHLLDELIAEAGNE
jgi:hypothetical protein